MGGSPQGDPSAPTPDTQVDPSKALQFTQDRWNDLKNSYVVWHQSIWQSLLYYANQSWIDWDDARKVWQPQQPTDEWVPRPRINRFSPTVDAVASNFAEVPEVEALPVAKDDPNANAIACVASKLSRYAMFKEGLRVQTGQKSDRAGMAAQCFVLMGGFFTIIDVENNPEVKQKQQELAVQGYTCPTCDTYEQMEPGTGAPSVCPQCGNPVQVENSTTMAPALDDLGNPVNETVDNFSISLKIGNSLYAFPRPGATSIEDSPYLLWAERMPTDFIYNKWGFQAQPDAIWPDGYSVTYEHALNFWYTGYSNTAIQIKDSCMTLRMYVAPGKLKDFPSGFYNVVINDQPAHTEDWDFPEHPVTQASYLILPTLFFPRSIAFDLCEIQRELNAYESIIKLHAMTSAVDPIVIDANTMVNEITGRSDKIIKWRPIGPGAQPPTRLQAGHLDDGIYAQRESLHAEFQNISMAVNALRGQQEGGTTAASAIQQLRAQAEQMFSKPMNNWNNAWRETMRKYVKFMQKYMSVAQLASLVGDDSAEDVQAFKGADLDKTLEWVASSTGLPRTRDERRQELMALWDKGALDTNQPEVRQKISELFGETGMMQSFNRDATNARLENNAMQNGALNIKPMPMVEDIQVHLFIHKDCAKSLDFQKWPPQAQQALYTHIIETQQAVQQAMVQAQEMQVLSQAGMKPSPAPSWRDAQAQFQSQMGQNAQGQRPGMPQTPTTAARPVGPVKPSGPGSQGGQP